MVQPFTTVVVYAAEGATVYVAGELDLAAESAFAAAILGCLDTDLCQSIRVVMRDVTFMDCAGLGVLIGCHHQARSAGVSLVVERPSPRVARMLALCGATTLVAA